MFAARCAPAGLLHVVTAWQTRSGKTATPSVDLWCLVPSVSACSRYPSAAAVQAEVDRLLFDDPDPDMGFMLHPDLKWDQTQPQSLYCLALCHRHGTVG